MSEKYAKIFNRIGFISFKKLYISEYEYSSFSTLLRPMKILRIFFLSGAAIIAALAAVWTKNLKLLIDLYTYDKDKEQYYKL